MPSYFVMSTSLASVEGKGVDFVLSVVFGSSCVEIVASLALCEVIFCCLPFWWLLLLLTVHLIGRNVKGV